MKKNLLKGMRAFMLAMAGVAMLLGGVNSALACTGFYVGADETDDGYTYYGRSEDYSCDYPKVFEVREAADHAAGEMYEDVYGFSCPYPAHTLRFTAVRDSLEQEEGGDAGISYAAAGQNEAGVAMTATVSTYENDMVDTYDPLVDTGICEISMVTLVLQEATSAKNGIEILANIVDTYGAGECNIIFISDATETWYMEIVSGHQYAAMKLPSNKCAIVPNMMMMGQISTNSADMITSAELVSLPAENGFLVNEGEEDQYSINVAKTYSCGYGDHSTFRYWQGLYFLNAGLAEGVEPGTYDVDECPSIGLPNAIEDSAKGPFELLFDADRALSLTDVQSILKQRGEGTQYESNATDFDEVYPIANQNQAECHFFQVKNDLPMEISTVEWVAMSDAEFSLFVPGYTALLTETESCYAYEETEYTEGSIFWTFNDIAKICRENRGEISEEVALYLTKTQAVINARQESYAGKMAEAYTSDYDSLTDLANTAHAEMTKYALENGQYVLNAIKDYQAGNTTEFKLGDPEGFLDTMVEEPTDNNSTASGDTDGQGQSKAGNQLLIVFAIILLVLVIAGICYYVSRKKKTVSGEETEEEKTDKE